MLSMSFIFFIRIEVFNCLMLPGNMKLLLGTTKVLILWTPGLITFNGLNSLSQSMAMRAILIS